MKEWLGKVCQIKVVIGGRELFYSGCVIKKVSDTHITFTDKFGIMYSYIFSCISQISESRI